MPSYMDELIEQMKNKKASMPSEEKKEKKPTAKPKEEVLAEIPELVDATPEEENQKNSSENEQEMLVGGKIIDSYGNVKIYSLPKSQLPVYFAPTPKPTAAEKTIINTIKEAATRLITISPYRIRDLSERKNVYFQKVMEILQSSPQLKIPQRRWDFYANSVVTEMVGYGLIDSLVNDDLIEEIMIIGPKKPVYIFHRKHEMMTTNVEFYSDQEITDLINRIARQVGRRVDISSPMLDARLSDGSRINATIPPASVDGATLTVRKFRKDPYSIIDLITSRTLDTYTAAFLWACSEGMSVKPANMLISGGTSSGKTTTLNALAAFVPPYERVITIEDTAELNLPLKHWIRLEGRPPSLEGKGEITLDILTKNSLRMRPDRIIVGEIRHEEAFTFFTAINTGHEGCFGTVHANSAYETIVRVTSPPMNVPEVMLASLDIILVEQRLHDKKKGTIRRVTEIAEVTGVMEGKAKAVPIFEYDPTTDILKRTKKESEYLKTAAKYMGKPVEYVEKIILKREKFLKELVDKDIHMLEPVTQKCLEHLLTEK